MASGVWLCTRTYTVRMKLVKYSCCRLLIHMLDILVTSKFDKQLPRNVLWLCGHSLTDIAEQNRMLDWNVRVYPLVSLAHVRAGDWNCAFVALDILLVWLTGAQAYFCFLIYGYIWWFTMIHDWNFCLSMLSYYWWTKIDSMSWCDTLLQICSISICEDSVHILLVAPVVACKMHSSPNGTGWYTYVLHQTSVANPVQVGTLQGVRHPKTGICTGFLLRDYTYGR